MYQIFGRQLRVKFIAFGFFKGFHDMIELNPNPLSFLGFDTFGLFHDHIRVHGDQSSIGVINKAIISGLFDETWDGLGA